MNKPLPDGNENILDIFVVSTCTSESPVQVTTLEELGYRVTCFSDTNQLFESFRTGKPNLLICDPVTLGDAAYDLCRTLKDDPDLWVIPVLIVTGASNLSDLLHVLDCNADNFISTPYDEAYLSAIIEGLLATPVERQTPDQIKTQFKIQHDDQLFVVTADRRKLLEFLLSSFEIAVSRSGEIIRISNENDALSSSLAASDARVRDQDTALDTHARTIDQNEQSIRSLKEDLADRHRRIQDHTDEISRLEQELESRDTRIASTEDQARRLSSELQDLTTRYAAETGDLKQQVTSLTGCLTSTHAELDAVRESLAGERKQKAETEARLLESESLRSKAEESLQALALECEQLKSALSTEKTRAESAEQEVKTLVQAKNEAEQDLISTINEFKTVVQNQDAELLQHKEVLTARDARIAVLENRAAELESEKTIAHAELQTCTESAAATISGLNTRIDELNATLTSKEQEIESRNTALAYLEEEKNRVTQDLQSLSEKLSLVQAHLMETENRYQAEIGQINADLRERNTRIDELSTDLRAVQDECETYRHSLEKIRYELEEATTARTNLEASLDEAQVTIRSQDSDLHTAMAATAGADQEVQRLTGELAGVRGELDAIRLQHQETKQSLHAELGEKEQVSGRLQEISRQRDAFEQDLAEERRIHAELASEKERLIQQIEASAREVQARESALEERIGGLTSDLDNSRSACRDLELQVSAISQEKQRVEEQVSNLSAEIDQARAALADEWEDHMNVQERLVAATSDSPPMVPPAPGPGEFESEKAKKRSLIVKGPDLPMIMGKQTHTMSVYPNTSPQESPVPRISNVEDLFEDEDPEENKKAPDTSATPTVSIIHEPSDMETWGADEESLADPDNNGVEFGEEGAESPGTSDTEENSDEYLPMTPPLENVKNIPPHFTFNRAQWFDLLKWSHHAGTLSQEQRMQIVRMGRLIQQGRKLTPKQEEQVMEMILLAQAQGFKFR